MPRRKRTGAPPAPPFEAPPLTEPAPLDLPADEPPLGWERTEHGFLGRSPESVVRAAASVVERLARDGVVSPAEAEVLRVAVGQARHYRETVLPRLDAAYAAIGAGKPRVVVNRLLERPDRLIRRGTKHNSKEVLDDYRRLVTDEHPADDCRRLYPLCDCGFACVNHARVGKARRDCAACCAPLDLPIDPARAVVAIAALHGFPSEDAALKFLERTSATLPKAQRLPLPYKDRSSGTLRYRQMP